VIKNAQEFADWFDASSPGGSADLSRERADLVTWMAIIEGFPRCHLAVVRNPTVPLEVLERLRLSRDFRVQWSVRSQRRWQDAYPDDAKPDDFDPDELAEYELTAIERLVLRNGLHQWAGPARCTEELAIGMGFSSLSDLFNEGGRIIGALDATQPMSHRDWARTLLATEIVFMSDVVGAASDWEAVTDISESDTFTTIRKLQGHIMASPLIGGFGTR
jgi:hypothetical protein